MVAQKTNRNLLKLYAVVQVIPLLSVLYLLWFLHQDQTVLALGQGDESLVGSALTANVVLPAVLGIMLITNLIVTPFVWRYRGVKQAIPMLIGSLVIVLYYVLLINNPYR
jgi:hypothetical protein